MIKKVFLVTNEDKKETTSFDELILLIKEHYKMKTKVVSYRDALIDYNETTLTLLYLSDKEIKFFFKNHLNSGMNIAILPTKENKNIMSSYGISSDIHEALDDGLNIKRFSNVDILLCNDEPAFTNIIIGDVHGLNNTSLEKTNFLYKMKDFFSQLQNLSFKDYTLTTSKDQKIQTASTGIMVLEHNVKRGNYNLINEEFSLHDGKLNAFVLSPTSLLSYIYYLFLVFFYSRFSLSTLPKSIGLIKTSNLTIDSVSAMDFKIDGILMSSKTIELKIVKNTFNIALGRNIKNIPQKNYIEDEKDTIKIESLPKDEMKNALINEAVPFFKKADENDFKELFLSLRQSAKLSSVFIVLMVLSTLLAATGLFQNSAPVIIGAMILAPLMAPIISLSMGIVRDENQLINNSMKTLFYGILTALLFSCLFSYMIPLAVLTDEMRGRLNPNILDLMVAIISGIAGAYASAKSEIAKSLAGVAIAVALVPPLSVTGIGIGWGDFDIVYGSFLLFITNLVGITLAASLTFLVLGYAPIHRAKKGLLYSFVILAMVSIPLVISFMKVIKQNNILTQLSEQNYIINNKNINVDILEVDLSKNIPTIFIQTKSDEVLKKEDLTLLNQKISTLIDDDILLNVDMRIVVQAK